MTFSLKHAFQSAKTDGADTSVVRPSDWNAEHTLSMATDRLLGRTSAGAGAVEEISVGTGLSLTAGTLSSTVTGTVTSVSGTGTVNGLTLTGTVTSSGSLTLGGTLSGVSLTSAVTGTLPVANGGTGTATQFTAGSVVFAGSSGVYTQDNANLFWDDTNNRLGIKTAIPTAELDVNGTINVPNQLNYDYTTSVLPDIAPALNLNFAQSKVVDPRITFTRSSTATFVGSNGLIQTAAVNTPRLDYDPVTRAPKGLLIEEQRTNLLTYSEQFNGNWTTSRASISANTAASPDGTQTADAIVEDTTAADSHAIYRSATLTAAAHTLSVFVKANGRDWIYLVCTAGTNAGAYFNISNGTVGTVSSGYTASIVAYGNGWYRCSIAFTATAATWYPNIYLATGDNSTIYTGDGTSGVIVWGAQLEAGAFATSYIPTVASQVTRTADVATITGANFSQWYNQSTGTFVADFDTVALRSGGVTTHNVANANDGTANNIVSIFASANFVAGQVLTGGVTQAYIQGGGSPANNVPIKLAIGYATNDVAVTANGAAPSTDTSATMPTGLTQLSIGSFTGFSLLNGHIRSIRYYPSRLTNAQLQALTA